jgi:hypothetical protein
MLEKCGQQDFNVFPLKSIKKIKILGAVLYLQANLDNQSSSKLLIYGQIGCGD